VTSNTPLEALIVALPETAGSALYGMIDVLSATGILWQQLVGEDPGVRRIIPRIVAHSKQSFACGNAIPVKPDFSVKDDPSAEVVILPELWLAPDDDMRGRHLEVVDWIRRQHQGGSTIYTACSGSVLLAATGLLDGCEATSHWAYQDLFRRSFPQINFQPDPSLVFADRTGRLVTAGGTTSWHDLAIHIIARHCSPGEALRIAKIYLLKLHGEGQLPYASLVRRQAHADAVAHCGIPERSLKRRFKTATGSTLIGYVQNLRIEAAKRMLEQAESSSDEIAAAVGYENSAFFRRLFKRSAGLTPNDYKRMFAGVPAIASLGSATPGPTD
jgi:transcriptional regulator GlxA family with amidase domain